MPATTTKEKRAFWLRQMVAIPAVIVLFAMMIHVVANALLRTYFQLPVLNTLELVQYWYMPIIALLGIIAAQQAGQHLAAELIYDRLTDRGKKFYTGFGLVLCIVICLGFTWFGLLAAINSFQISRTSGATGLPIWPVYFLVPITFGALTCQFGRLLVTGQELAVDADGMPGDES